MPLRLPRRALAIELGLRPLCEDLVRRACPLAQLGPFDAVTRREAGGGSRERDARERGGSGRAARPPRAPASEASVRSASSRRTS